MNAQNEWVYYRLFLRHPDQFNDFLTLLNEVVRPVIESFQAHVLHYHFFYYSGAYKDHAEGNAGVVERLKGISDDDYVGFIRLRIQCETPHIESIHTRIRELSTQTVSVLGYEQARTPYDPVADLGGRFGRSRTRLVMDLVEAASRLAVDFARGEEPFDPANGQGGSQGLIHLVANTLQYNMGTLKETDLWIRLWGEHLAGKFPPNVPLL